MTRPLAASAEIVRSILTLRGQRIVMAIDLAALYGVTVKRLNQQVTRNQDRFPEDFCFRLTGTERDEVIANCDHLSSLKFSPTLPLAFTEYGAVMAASVLNSPRAVAVSIQVVRTFVELRSQATHNRSLAARLDELEQRYDGQFKTVFSAIRLLVNPPGPKRRPIGF